MYVTDSSQYGGYFHGKWIITQFEENALELIREYEDEWGDTLRFNR